jgi:hypothetical protein
MRGYSILLLSFNKEQIEEYSHAAVLSRFFRQHPKVNPVVARVDFIPVVTYIDSAKMRTSQIPE